MKVRTIPLDIIICPECLPKIKRFKSTKNLNTHLTLKHHSKYKISMVENSTPTLLRIK